MLNKRFLYSSFIIIFTSVLFVNLSAQTVKAADSAYYGNEKYNNNDDTLTDETTTGNGAYIYTIRTIPADSLSAIKKEKAFAYMGNLDSLLRERNKEMIAELERLKQEGSKPAKPGYSFDIIKIFLWILAVAALLYLIYTIFLGNTSLFRTNRKNIDASFGETGEEETDNLSTQKIKAAANGNYRLAIRYAYLELLELLSNKNIIELRTDKTNYQYVSELSRQPWANAFASVTLKYEYIWYGKYEINKQLYGQIETEFDGLKQKIK